MQNKFKIAIFISGAGSNAMNIIKYFKKHKRISVSLIVSNKTNSGAKSISEETGVPYVILPKADFYESGKLISTLQQYEVDAVILAGFLLLIPESLIEHFPDKIINIHPSLLPKYGGKGMYGMHVHQAVKDAGETESGITIHIVNAEYDKGRVLFQKSVSLTPQDEPEDIARKIHQLEYKYFPQVIESYLQDSM